jgi:hypothetical protein
MLAQQRRIFAGEALFSVVHLLVPDVIAQMLVLVWRHAESAVAMLPFESPAMWNCIVNPLGGGCLDAVYQLREGQGAWRLKVEVNMVPCAASTQELAVSPFDHGAGAGE